MSDRHRFLITGARAPATLQLARLLGRSGHDVVVVDSMHHAAAYRSRWITGHTVLPPPAEAFKAFVLAAHQAIRQHAPDFIICTCEEIFYWAKAAELHPDEFAPYLKANPSFKTLRVLHNKGTFARLARQSAALSGVIVPETRISGALQGDGWVCKPSFSRFAVHTRLGLTAREAEAQIRHPGWIAQRQVMGREFCTWACFVAGREVASAAYQPLYRAGKGSGIGLRAVDAGNAALFARTLASCLNFTGQLAFDWIVNNDGCHVLECNPRSTSGIHFLDSKSQAFGDALSNALCGNPFTPVLGAQEDLALKWAMLLFGIPEMVRPQKGLEQRNFFRNARDIDSDPSDPGPTQVATMLTAFLEIVGLAIRRRSGLLSASTADIEWNGDLFWETP